MQKLALILIFAFLTVSSADIIKDIAKYFTYGEFPGLVQALGYPVEAHRITTEDGYILQFFRMQAKGQQSFKSGLPVVYLQHGFVDSADTWVINNEANAPGFQLANKGYDVWLGNSRGNKYCLDHVTLKASGSDFWQFTWQNMSQYDLPAAFEYIYKNTNQLINYVGHSQGTTIMFAALAENNPTILKYIKKFIALSPVVWAKNMKSGPIKLLASSPLPAMMQAAKINQFLPAQFLQSAFGSVFCRAFGFICSKFLESIAGADPEYDNFEQQHLIMQHEFAGTSVMNAMHWRQALLSGQFAKYDHGKEINMKRYGQNLPPKYDTTKIKIPLYILYGEKDLLVAEQDISTLLNSLTGSSKVFFRMYPGGHATFLWSKRIDFYFNDLLEMLDKP